MLSHVLVLKMMVLIFFVSLNLVLVDSCIPVEEEHFFKCIKGLTFLNIS